MVEQLETGCCPRFDPEPWDEKEVSWQDKLFVKDRVRSLFHIPLNFGTVIVRNMKKIEVAAALDDPVVCLSDENSLWGSDLYIAVNKEVPDTETAKISGTFMTKVFEGPYSNAGKWVREMQAYVTAAGRSAGQLYFFYTTCPKCAKAYGKNYTVLLAKV